MYPLFGGILLAIPMVSEERNQFSFQSMDIVRHYSVVIPATVNKHSMDSLPIRIWRHIVD